MEKYALNNLKEHRSNSAFNEVFLQKPVSIKKFQTFTVFPFEDTDGKETKKGLHHIVKKENRD